LSQLVVFVHYQSISDHRQQDAIAMVDGTAVTNGANGKSANGANGSTQKRYTGSEWWYLVGIVGKSSPVLDNHVRELHLQRRASTTAMIAVKDKDGHP